MKAIKSDNGNALILNVNYSTLLVVKRDEPTGDALERWHSTCWATLGTEGAREWREGIGAIIEHTSR